MIDLQGTHPADLDTMKRAGELAETLAREFGRAMPTIEHKRRPHPGGHDGICYQRENRIGIVIRYRERGQWWKRPLPEWYVMQTVCHEVAHLDGADSSPGLPDGPAHREFEMRIREYARVLGIACERKA